jgi:S1-C subfamily serine protease
MTDQTDFLSGISGALTARVRAARSSIAAIELSAERHLSGTLWGPDVVVTSEQALPRGDEFQVVLPGGAAAAARGAGRDPGTNIAVLRTQAKVDFAAAPIGETETGALVLALGATRSADATARLGIVNFAGPEWRSVAGARIDKRLVLDIRLGRSEEGGPVLDLNGARLGMSTFAPRGKVLVIPAATLDRVVLTLLKDGRVARGWLGIALQPVAVPEPLQGEAGEKSGLMVMSIADGGPAAKAGIVAGDIVLTVNGTPVRRLRGIASHLGSENIGRNADVRVIRAGSVVSLKLTIEARPAA